MIAGRCAGCGETSKSASEIREHTRYCPDYRALYARDPAAALDPEAEYQRWVSEDRGAERAGRREDAVAEADRRRAEQRDLLAVQDPLADEIDTAEAMQTAWEIIDAMGH